jgi:hypothetical protein
MGNVPDVVALIEVTWTVLVRNANEFHVQGGGRCSVHHIVFRDDNSHS